MIGRKALYLTRRGYNVKKLIHLPFFANPFMRFASINISRDIGFMIRVTERAIIVLRDLQFASP